MDISHRIRCNFGGVSGAARRRGFGEDREGQTSSPPPRTSELPPAMCWFLLRRGKHSRALTRKSRLRAGRAGWGEPSQRAAIDAIDAIDAPDKIGYRPGPNATGRPRLRRLRRFCRVRRKPSGMRPARRAGPTGRNRPPGGPKGAVCPARPPLGAPAGRGRPPGGPKGAVCPCPLLLD